MNIKNTILLFAFGSGALFATAFQNGGFEAPVISSSPNFSTVPTGWVKVDPSGVGLFSQFYATFGLPGLNGEGLQAYGFGGNGIVAGSLSQTFDTVAATNYAVNFQYVVQQGFEFEDLKVEALDGSTVLASNSIRFNDRAWAFSTLNFTAASATTTLRFSDVTGVVDPGFGGSTNWALDAVTVNGTGGGGGATPEPSTMGLVVLGSLAAFVLRRSKAHQKD